MTPTELFWLFESKLPPKRYAGDLDEDDMAELYEMTFGEAAPEAIV